MAIRKALKYEFNTISTLSSKVFPIQAQEGQEVPYLTYQLQDNDRVMVQNGFDGLTTVQFEIDMFQKTYSDLIALKLLVIAKVKSFLFRNIGEESLYCQSCEIDDEYEDFDDDTKLYHGQFTMNISYRE